MPIADSAVAVDLFWRRIQRYAQARGFRPAAPAAAAKPAPAACQALLNGGLDAQPLAA